MINPIFTQRGVGSDHEQAEVMGSNRRFLDACRTLDAGTAKAAHRTYLRKAGGGRPPKSARLVFEAIVHLLRTGCQWRALPFERFGSCNAIHARFLK